MNHSAHWLFWYCNKDKNGVELNGLINKYDYFEKSACISKYYVPIEAHYYDIRGPKFVGPSIANGTFNDENKNMDYIYKNVIIK